MTQLPEPTAPAAPHRQCSQLQAPGAGDDTVSRFILHLDAEPVLLDDAALATELNDHLAGRLFSAGIFPNTAGELLQALEQVDPSGPLSQHGFFLVGEGSQLPADVEADRNMRFLVTVGRGPEGAEMLVSAFHPDESIVEVMAWDHQRGGFNYYRTMQGSNAWVFAGNSAHALVAPTRGSGPFESHVNGNAVMKELKEPWVHWHSPLAAVPASSLAAQGLDRHPWVGRLDPGGAYTLENVAVKPAIRRWSAARAAAIAAGSSVETPARMLEQLTETLTANIFSSRTTFDSAVGGSTPQIDLPSTFFVDEGMLELVGLPRPPRFLVSASVYAQTVEALDVTITDGRLFTRSSDTHFAFVVPERAFEDVATIQAGLTAGLFTPRLIATLLMVDFPNPIFSVRRSTLTRYLALVDWTGAAEADSDAVADAILNASAAANDATAEAEFARNWAEGDNFLAAFGERLAAYYGAVTAALASPESFAQIYRLAESRRGAMELMPIAESRLLFPRSNVSPIPRAMTEIATVEEVPTA